MLYYTVVFWYVFFVFPFLDKEIGDDAEIALEHGDLLVRQPGDVKHMNVVVADILVQGFRDIQKFFDGAWLVPWSVRAKMLMLYISRFLVKKMILEKMLSIFLLTK